MLDRRAFLVREHAGALRLVESYDVVDPMTGELLAQAGGRATGTRRALERFVARRRLPFDVELCDPGGEVLLELRRGTSLLGSRVRVLDAERRTIAWFRLGRGGPGHRSTITNAAGVVVAGVTGDLAARELRFIDLGGRALGHVTRDPDAVAEEQRTPADRFAVVLAEGTDAAALAPLLVAAAICIDLCAG